jgi:hypothetical protein
VLGVALFGSLLGGAGAFVTGVRLSLIILVALLFGAAATIMLGPYKESPRRLAWRGDEAMSARLRMARNAAR